MHTHEPRSPRRQKDDRHLRALPQDSHQGEAIQLRKHDVEHDQARKGLREGGQSRLAIGRRSTSMPWRGR